MRTRGIGPAGYLALAFLTLLPSVARAQSGIAGSVRDATGAVLPGVTVEATSPVLIEKARTVVTDGEGLYRVVDLRPGTYTITFSLPGFATVQREGIELPAAFTATVNVEMRVGAVRETVTVSGAAPVVDVQNVLQQRVLSKEMLENIPSSRTPQAFMFLTPGATGVRLGNVPGSVNELSLGVHGSGIGESQITLDGDKAVMISLAGSGGQPMRFNQAYIQEISVTTGAASAEQETGGLTSTIIPKEGGNSISGYLYAGLTDESLQGNNLSNDLIARGLTSISRIVRNYDVTPAVGGPIVRDKLWFYSSFRFATSRQTIAGLYYDLNATDWVYTPDLNRPAVDSVYFPDQNTRLTWQATPKNHLSVFVERSGYGQGTRGLSNQLISPEASRDANHVPNVFGQIIWKSTVTSRLLLQAGFSTYYFDREQRRLSFVGPDAIAATDVAGVVPGIAFRAPPPNVAGSTDSIADHWYTKNWDYKASAAYVTGSHSFKGGLTVRTGTNLYSARTGQDLAFTLRSGVPISLLQTATPWQYVDEVKPNLGLFAQDQWTLRKLTVNGGVRFDYFRARDLATHLPSTRWAPARDFPAVDDVPNWKDLSPRLGVAYDLFGDGKTALKATLNRYVNGEGTGTADANHPVIRSVLDATRTWNDTNGNYIPDCDLVDPLANGECGQISNLNFGRNNPNATTYADGVLRGFGVRPYSWTASTEIQRQVARGTSVTAGYYRRWAGNFRATDNQLVTPADFDPFCVTAPSDPRLPGGGGYQVCGLYDVRPQKFGQVVNRVVQAETFGQQSEIYNGFDLTGNARFANGALISGGLNIGRTATNTCFVVDSPQALLNCDVKPPFQSNAKIFGVYPLPWLGIQTSAVLQVVPGPEITASYVARNAEVVPSLGRNLAAGAAGTVTVPLISPGTLYADSSKQLDVRFTKRFTLGRARLEGNLDVFNVLNAGGVQIHNTNFGTGWLQPRMIQLPRYVMFSTQVNF